MQPSSESQAAAASPRPAGAGAGGSTASSAAAAETTVTLPVGVDLHARPAAHFVRAALGFGARIVVSAGSRDADAKSLLSVLALGAKAGTTLRLSAEGDDGPLAVEALERCVAGLTD